MFQEVKENTLEMNGKRKSHQGNIIYKEESDGNFVLRNTIIKIKKFTRRAYQENKIIEETVKFCVDQQKLSNPNNREKKHGKK